MQRAENLQTLSVHWGLIIRIFLMLCQMEASEKQQGFGKERTGSRAFYGSCAQIRSAILRVKRYQLVGHFFWAGDERLVELLDHPDNLCNFFALNSKLNWLTAYLGDEAVAANDIYCLSGHTDMIQKVLDSRILQPMSPSKIRRYCLLTLMSERPEAIIFFCKSMRIQSNVLLPVIVRNKFVKESESAQLKKTLFYELCLHGNAAAWQCFANLVTEAAIENFISSSTILDVLISDEHETQLMHPYSFRALLQYCDPIKNQLALANFRARMMKTQRLDLVSVLLDFVRPKSTLGKMESHDLRVIVKSGDLSLLKKVLACNPVLMQQLKNPDDSLGCNMVGALLEAESPNQEMLAYFNEELKIQLDGKINDASNLFLVVFKSTVLLKQVLKYFPGFVKCKNHSDESPLRYLLRMTTTVCHRLPADDDIRNRCFANVIALINAGADPHDAFNLAPAGDTHIHFNFMWMNDWPLFNEAVISLLQANLNLDQLDSQRFPIAYDLLNGHEDLNEQALSLVLSQPFKFENCFVQARLDFAFYQSCATRSAALIELFIAKGATLEFDSVERAIEINFTHTDAKSCYEQFCHELCAGEQLVVTGLTGLDLAIINARIDVVRVITEKMPREKLEEALSTKHLNHRKTTYELAVALNNQEIIHIIDCLLAVPQKSVVSVGL